MPKIRLTDSFVKKTPAPETGRNDYFDTVVVGLEFRITSANKRSWSTRYRVGSKRPRFTLGTYPALSLSQAREAALEAIRATQKGQDLQREKQAARTAVSPQMLSEAFADFIEGYAKKQNRSWKEVESLFENEIRQKLGKRPLADITRADLIARFDDIKAPHTANKAYRYMGRFFRWCLEKGRIDENPMTSVALPHPEVEKARDRVLSDEEIMELWVAWNRLAYPFGDLFKLLLVLGQRRNEVGSMRWRDLNLKEKQWAIPREATKSDRAHIVPLSPLALELIEGIPKQGKVKWVFTTTGKTSVSGYSKVKARLDKWIKEAREQNEHEDMPPWRIHDIRRTVASGLARMKTPQIVIEKVQNRVTGEGAGVAGVYNRYSYMEEREAALTAWARHIETLVNPDGASGDVIEFQVHKG